MVQQQKKKASAFMQPVPISKDLAAVVGPGPLPRTEIIKLLWAYIKKHHCQDKKNKRNIIPDEKLAKILGKNPIDMFKMTKEVSKHIQ